MLKILFLSLRLLLLLKYKNNITWHIVTSLIFISSAASLTLIYSPLSNPLTINNFSIDTIRSPLISLTLWISALSMLPRYFILYTYKNHINFLFLTISIIIVLTLAFSSTNLLFFYFIFETSLIPIFLIILTWGYQPERLQAAFYLLIYTIVASLPLLINILFIYFYYGHLSFISISRPLSLPSNLYFWWWLSLILAFLVKTPIFITHLWLPKAHVEAPVAGSIILAGILLKLGTYGLLRLTNIFPMPSNTASPLITSICLIGAIITSLICLRQTDLKALIAYSSVAHMALLTAGIITSSSIGNSGALSIIIAHGLSSSALFAVRFIIYESTSSRSVYLTKGISILFPHLTLIWFILCATNIAAPPSLNLLREILLIIRVIPFSYSTWLFISFLSFLSAAYSLFLYTSSQHGSTPQLLLPINLYSSKTYLTAILHILPIIFIIFKPDVIIA